MPAPGAVHRHPVGLHSWRYGAGPAEPHPPGLRHPFLTNVPEQAAHVPMLPAPPHDAEPLIPSGLAPRRPPSRIPRVEKRGHRLGEVPQCLLLHRLRARGQPRILGPRLRELSALRQVTWRALPSRMPVLVLLDGQIPHVPGMAAVVDQHRFLRGGWEEPVPGHANILSITADISGEAKRRFLAGHRVGSLHAASLMVVPACLPDLVHRLGMVYR